jgi:putative DNA polymerase III, alpha subunit
MNELIEWLERNKIQYNIIDEEVIEIPGMGQLFFEDTEKINSIFRLNPDGELIFNSVEEPHVLMNEGINFIVFKFGDNWYYTDLRKDFALNILKYVGERQKPIHNVEFVNLGVHTPYELLNGSFMPKEWVKKAQYLGHKALGVCDKNTMASLYAFQRDCEAAGINPVFGYSLTVNDGVTTFGGKVFVQSQKGLRNLLRIQKAIMVDSDDKTIYIEELLNHAEGNVFVFDKYSTEWIDDNLSEWVPDFLQSFDKVFYQVDLSEYKAERIDIRVLESTKAYFHNVEIVSVIKPILLSDCYYLDKDDAKNKIILNKVAEGTAHEQSDDQYFKDVDEHYAWFEKLFDAERYDIPALFAECCENTIKVANDAVARFDNTRNYMPKYDMTDEEKAKYGTTHNMFNQLLEEGLQRLVPPEKQEQYRKQMEYEKYIIESTNNVDYLLVQYDTVNFCRSNGILVGCGRGSAAGSLLLYLLGITLIDPIKYDLIFERFLLPERAGLYPAQTTIIGEDIDSTKYVEVELEGSHKLLIDVDAQLIVKRKNEDEPIIVYADELQEGDDIMFDNKDELFTINEI